MLFYLNLEGASVSGYLINAAFVGLKCKPTFSGQHRPVFCTTSLVFGIISNAQRKQKQEADILTPMSLSQVSSDDFQDGIVTEDLAGDRAR